MLLRNSYALDQSYLEFWLEGDHAHQLTRISNAYMRHCRVVRDSHDDCTFRGVLERIRQPTNQ
jgi:hypothetical protein